MLLLALDTSTTAITAALHDGSGVIAEATTLDARAAAEQLAPNITEVLETAGVGASEVTEVVVGVGPGPFTGLRVSIVSGRTFGFVGGIPVHGIASHDALAHAAWLRGHRGPLLVATDARRKEVYAAVYRLDDAGDTDGSHPSNSTVGVVRLEGPVVEKAIDLPESWRAMPVIGRGPQLYPEAFTGEANPELDGLLDVSAGALADLAVRRLAADPSGERGFDGLEPLYLRRPDAAVSVSTKSTLG